MIADFCWLSALVLCCFVRRTADGPIGLFALPRASFTRGRRRIRFLSFFPLIHVSAVSRPLPSPLSPFPFYPFFPSSFPVCPHFLIISSIHHSSFATSFTLPVLPICPLNGHSRLTFSRDTNLIFLVFCF
ncbi:hypothetical protein niasHS_012341 [Heterodera schachtii]|uniref:Secreted protein n=1 Tax=Heterodera schachtii TaxID=97005 RepID=A0ABD2INH5_HETSC